MKDRKYLFSFLMLLATLFLLAAPALAAERSAAAELTIRQTFSYKAGAAPKDTAVSYRLSAVDLDGIQPAPGNEYVPAFSLSGTESRTVSLSFSTPGVYRFTLQPVVEKEARYFTYSKEIYHITVYVENQKDTLASTVIVTDDSGKKQNAIEFSHRYEPPVNTPKTGDSVNPALWCGMAAGSAGIAAALLLLRRHTKKSEEFGGNHHE